MPVTKCLPVLLTFVALVPAQEVFLKEGDTVVFYGDSITDQRLDTTFVETFAVTRYPQDAHDGPGRGGARAHAQACRRA